MVFADRIHYLRLKFAGKTFGIGTEACILGA
jgi:hypothetical protein